jgi:hypothetical protein
MRQHRALALVALVGGALALASVAGCGVRGDLVPAPPVFGEARRDYDARQAEAEAQRKREAPGQQAPQAAPQPGQQPPSSRPQ